MPPGLPLCIYLGCVNSVQQYFYGLSEEDEQKPKLVPVHETANYFFDYIFVPETRALRG